MSLAKLATSFIEASVTDSKGKKIFTLELNSFEYNVAKSEKEKE